MNTTSLRHVTDLLDNAHQELMVESASLPDDHPLAQIRQAIAIAATNLEAYVESPAGESK